MRCIKHIRCELGESPVWHPITKQYYWVDITQKHIHCLSQDKSSIQTIELIDKVGCIVPAKNGNLIAALAKQIVEVDVSTHDIRLLHKPTLSADEMFNDGKVDCMGRFWLASKDIQESRAIAKLYCYDGKTFTTKQEEVTIGNGMGWSLDNSKMYFTDSPAQTIYQYDYDKQNGVISNRQIFARISNGYPDGLSVDNQGRLWSTHWDGACVTCYNTDGSIECIVEMPVKRPTSCCFGGESLQELFITSASIFLDYEDSDKDGFSFIDDSLATGSPANVYKQTR